MKNNDCFQLKQHDAYVLWRKKKLGSQSNLMIFLLIKNFWNHLTNYERTDFFVGGTFIDGKILYLKALKKTYVHLVTPC